MQSKTRFRLAFLASVVVSAAGFLAVYCVAPSFEISDPAADKTGKTVGLISFRRTEINAGNAQSPSERRFLFSLQNISGEAVFIDTVTPDCTCISATHERMIQPSASSEITVRITPSTHKTRYVVNVLAKQGRRVQADKLSVVFASVESKSIFFDPPTVMIGELIAQRPFNVKRKVRIVGPNGDSIHPIAVDGPKWINVDLGEDEGCTTLAFTGVAPESNAINRDVIGLFFSEPIGRASLEFAYSLRPRYVVEPQRVFGFSDKNSATAGTIELKGVYDTDTVQWAVTMESQGAVEISRESNQGQFRISPQFTDDIDEISGCVTWTVYAESKEKVGECLGEFFFVRAAKVDYRHDKD
jgi:hypothetical protein